MNTHRVLYSTGDAGVKHDACYDEREHCRNGHMRMSREKK